MPNPSHYRQAQHWQTFKSPLKGNIDLGVANVLEDWNRLDTPVLIGGERVQAILKRDRNLQEEPKCPDLFNSLEELQDFFDKHILKNVLAEHKAAALEFLMKSMHQGGLLNPVSSVAYSKLSDLTKGEIGPADSKNRDENGIPGQQRQTAFVVTDDGFMVQEKVTQNRLQYAIQSNKAGESILPDKGKDYVYEAQATIKVTFPETFNPAKDKYAPSITSQSATINYGNKEVAKLLDGRSWLEKIADAIKKAIGRHKVQDIAPDVRAAKKPAEIEMQALRKRKP